MMRRGVAALACLGAAAGLGNGLAQTPPMGFMLWERFRCTTNCTTDPDLCVSEKLVKQIADILGSPEYREAGYEYLNIDDCWSAKQRDANGALTGDPERFPSGMKALADYVHSKGLRFGLYNDIGTQTCSGYPAACTDVNCTGPGNYKTDATTFASWGTDSLKMDGCNSVHTPAVLDAAYTNYGRALNASGQPVLYACSWPYYVASSGYARNLTKVRESCNYWRWFDDIQDSWDSVVSIIDAAAGSQDELIAVSGPGGWNDLDSIIVGNFGLSYEQAKTQFALWSIMASPLLLGNDPRNLDPAMKKIVLSKEVIAVNQDQSKQGRRVVRNTDPYVNHDVWVRELTNGDVAVGVWNRCIFGTPLHITFTWADIGLPAGEKRAARDLYAEADLGTFADTMTVTVNVDGTVMLRLSKL